MIATTERPRVRIPIALAAVAALAACASLRYGRMAPPSGTSALGLEFGADREVVERALAQARIASRPSPGDRDALLADRCPSTPVDAPCRILFGPRGLFAVQVDVPAAEIDALESSVGKGLGAPDRSSEPAQPGEGIPSLASVWHPEGWTVTVSRSAADARTPVASLRVERDAFAPPVVAGVPLGRLREDVELALDRQGATLVQREENATTYLGCPQGSGDALSCVVLFRDGRAAVVTEVHPAAGDDRAALDGWRILARRFEKDIGRPPLTACPDYGPDRVTGDCTATWASERLVVVVGAHRNAGASHRGTISVYTAFTYPPLAARGDEGDAR